MRYKVLLPNGKRSKPYSREQIEKAYTSGKIPDGSTVLSEDGETTLLQDFCEESAAETKPEVSAESGQRKLRRPSPIILTGIVFAVGVTIFLWVNYRDSPDEADATSSVLPPSHRHETTTEKSQSVTDKPALQSHGDLPRRIKSIEQEMEENPDLELTEGNRRAIQLIREASEGISFEESYLDVCFENTTNITFIRPEGIYSISSYNTQSDATVLPRNYKKGFSRDDTETILVMLVEFGEVAAAVLDKSAVERFRTIAESNEFRKGFLRAIDDEEVDLTYPCGNLQLRLVRPPIEQVRVEFKSETSCQLYPEQEVVKYDFFDDNGQMFLQTYFLAQLPDQKFSVQRADADTLLIQCHEFGNQLNLILTREDDMLTAAVFQEGYPESLTTSGLPQLFAVFRELAFYVTTYDSEPQAVRDWFAKNNPLGYDNGEQRAFELGSTTCALRREADRMIYVVRAPRPDDLVTLE